MKHPTLIICTGSFIEAHEGPSKNSASLENWASQTKACKFILRQWIEAHDWHAYLGSVGRFG